MSPQFVMPTGAHSLTASGIYFNKSNVNCAERGYHPVIVVTLITSQYLLLKASLEASDTLDVYST